ncbi:hypothetical protein CGSMWGv1400E_02304, partial [Gardnerella vaginalis 1400E]
MIMIMVKLLILMIVFLLLAFMSGSQTASLPLV